MSVSSNSQLKFNLTQTGTGLISGTQVPIPLTLQSIFTDGNGADQIDGIYADTIPFTASTAQTLDLQSLTDIFGASLSFAKVRLIAINVKSTTDGASLTLSPNASNGWTALGSSLNLPILASTSNQDGYFTIAAPNTSGYAVASSDKALDLTPSAHAFDVDIIIAGINT